MTLDMPSFFLGFIICASIAYAWMQGRDSAIRLARRIVRHRGNLDQVFFEDAEKDVTIERPKPATAEVTHLRESGR